MPHVPRNRCCYPDAAQIAFFPSDLSDWLFNPGTVQLAIDELGDRVHEIELNGGGGPGGPTDASLVAYTPSSEALSCWYGSSDPGNVNDALDQVSLRLCDIESNPILYYIFDIQSSPPSNPTVGQFYYNSVDGLAYFYNGSSWISMSSGSASSVPFSGITSGTNTSAAMTVGTGSSLTYSGSGSINASLFQGSSTISHGSLSNLTSGDDHTQYIFNVPTSSSRNVITPTGTDIKGLVVKQSSAGTSHYILDVQSLNSRSIMRVEIIGSSDYRMTLNTNDASAGTLGYIKMDAYSGQNTGNINTSASSTASGGFIKTQGGYERGGNINTSCSSSKRGGDIFSYGGADDVNSPPIYGGQGGDIFLYGGRTQYILGSAGNGSIINGYGGDSGSLGVGGNGGIINIYGGNGGDGGYGGNGSTLNIYGGSANNGFGGSAGSISTYGGNGNVSGGFGGEGAAGGNIDSHGSSSIDGYFGSQGGNIRTYGGDCGTLSSGGRGGNIYTYGGSGGTSGAGGQGGNINMIGSGGSGATSGANGGNLTTSANGSRAGGSINTSAGASAVGGSITTSNGGGSIDTTGNGSIQFGIAANRITVQGTASSAGRIYTIPNVGVDTFFVMSAGTQIVSGAKTFQPTSDYVPLIIKGFSSQTNDLLQISTNGGSALLSVSSVGDLWILGNLTVMGTTTTINTQTVLVEDNFITLNSIASVIDAGIEIERYTAGTGDNAFLRFKESVDQQWYLDNGTYEWVMGRKSTGTITGNAVTTSFNITHNMSTKNVIVQVYNSSNLLVSPQVDTTDVNYVTITFSPAPGNGVIYRVVIMG